MERAKSLASSSVRLTASLLAMLLLAAGCAVKTGELPQGPPREIRIINNVEVADDDRTLAVRYWGTECEEFSDAEIEYGITQIKLTIHALVAAEECRRTGLQQTAHITLGQPLDSRMIIDANIDAVVWTPELPPGPLP